MSSGEADRTVAFGHTKVIFPSSQLQELQDCNHLLHDIGALHKELDDKGYLFVRGLHDRDEVHAAKDSVLEYINSLGEKLSPQYPLNEGVLKEGCGLGCLPFMEGRNNITHSTAVINVLQGTRPFKFFERIFGESVKTFDYKWLRAVHTEGFTGAHCDSVYMSRGSKRLMTMWTPVGDTPVERGVLAVCEGSHRLPSFQRLQETYGNMDAEAVNLNGTGWFTEDPFEITQKFGGQWKTADFKAGDVIIFGMRLVHMSTTNTTHFARISCDTRWQPGSDPVDKRFCGDNFHTENNFGLQNRLEVTEEEKQAKKKQQTTIDQLKVLWGF